MIHEVNLTNGSGKSVNIKFNSYNIHIKDSYKITTTKEMRFILNLLWYAAENRDIKYKRSVNSWIREWKAHNILYKFNIRRTSTRDVDLNEAESFIRRFGYFVLSLFYWK